METSQKEMDKIAHLLAQLGFCLEDDQPHISGERFLTSPEKLVLVGRKIAGNQRVIIKMSRFLKAKEEIRQEKKIRDILSSRSPFAQTLLVPTEIFFGQKGSYRISVTEYIPQEQVFTSYPLQKQFSIILKSFRVSEKLNVNIFGGKKEVLKTLLFLQAEDYLKNFEEFYLSTLQDYHTPGLEEAMKEARGLLEDNKKVIKNYEGFLVHTDFAPHNFRVKNNSLYRLDCSAFAFGNKYEELARLLNYMIIHNPTLERKIKEYILNKRGESEYLSLKLMRIYKTGYLLKFYTHILKKTSRDLLALTIHRIEFWEEVLRCITQDRPLDKKILQIYLENRDHLRSAEEKKRQREFASA